MDDVTQLLQRASAGDEASLGAVFSRLYAELRQIAAARLRGSEATLTPTVLVHEAFLRLCSGEPLALAGRKHFYATAAQAMRWIIVDHARRALAGRRGGDLVRVELDEAQPAAMTPESVVALDAALDALGRIDPARRELVELRWFAGLEYTEMAELLGRSERTLKREWAAARAALITLMGE